MVKLKTKLENEDMNLDDSDLPIASMVIQEYRLSNQNLRETLNSTLNIKRILVVLVMILLAYSVAISTYVIVYWDTMHPHAGAIQEKSD